MSNDKLNDLRVILCNTYLAIDTLNASRRDKCAEYNERIRKLRELTLKLSDQVHNNKVELFDVQAVLDPKIMQLVNDPTHHL